MNIQLSERIKACEKNFSKGQKIISKFIEEHYDKVAFMTASRFGKTAGVSESTVVRFATEIGYAGYPQMQQAMQEMIRNKLTSVQRLEITYANTPTTELLDASIEQDISIIKKTRAGICKEDFNNAVEAISNAKNVYILGAGSSLALATFLTHYLNLVFDHVILLEATSEARILQQLMRIGKDDAVIGISFPRYSKRAVKALKYSVDKGACAVAITDSPLSPLAEDAQHVLIAKSDMVSFVDSLVGPLSLINALIVAIAIKRKDDVTKSLQTLEDIWDEYGVYEKVEENNQ